MTPDQCWDLDQHDVPCPLPCEACEAECSTARSEQYRQEAERDRDHLR